jgi:4'-phosphopantetheinyl transferase
MSAIAFRPWRPPGSATASRGVATPELGAAEAHLWSVDLAVDADRLAWLGSVLGSEERARAARFRFDRHRRRYVVAQGALRLLLGGYTALAPAALGFALGRRGKPSLVEDPGLHFNLTHSADLAVVAVARRGPVGVDIERRRELADADDIARRFFAPGEVATYLSLPPARRPGGFFDCWTRKEAFVKALGEGLFVSLDRFEVSLAPDEPARLLTIEGDSGAARAWSLTAFEPAADFAGALATEWHPAGLRAWALDLEAAVPPAEG